MNYQLHYDRLIEKYGTWEKPVGIYTERHRKLPGCMGGKYVKGNAFFMTAEAHFVAHQLLVKLNPNNGKVIFAARTMTVHQNGKRSNNKMFGWLKKRHAKAMSMLHTGRIVSTETRVKQSLSLKGKRRTAEQRAAMKGRTHSNETRAKQSAIKRGKKASAEACANMSVARKGKKSSSETRAKLSSRQLGDKNHMFGRTGEKNHMFGKKHSAKSLAKMSASQSGEKHPMFGKKASAETRAKQSASLKGRKISLETRALLSASRKGKPWSEARRAAYEARK